jgi:hypothetical protein
MTLTGRIRLFAGWLRLVWIFARCKTTGGPGFGPRLSLGLRALRAYLHLRRQTATSFPEQLVLLDSVLRLRPDVEGDVAEFGCFKGASSVILSIGARATGRRLIIFDSFEGLPEPGETIRSVAKQTVIEYRRGMYAGQLDEVRANIGRWGEPDAVQYVQGFYSETLGARPADERYAFIFEDADLVSSVKDILRESWPRLVPGCPFFSHEAQDLEVCQIFFDRAFWGSNLNCRPPGLVGVGIGIPVNAGGFDDARIDPLPCRRGSCLAYVFKE